MIADIGKDNFDNFSFMAKIGNKSICEKNTGGSIRNFMLFEIPITPNAGVPGIFVPLILYAN